MERNLTKNRLAIILTSIVMLITLTFMFCGCNAPQTITNAQIKSAITNLNTKMETLTTTEYTLDTTPAKTPAGTDLSRIGLPYSHYSNISDLKAHISSDNLNAYVFYQMNGIFSAFVTPTLTILNDENFDITKSYEINNEHVSSNPVTLEFTLNNETRTATIDYTYTAEAGQTTIEHTTMVLKLTENSWESCHIYHTIRNVTQNNKLDSYIVVSYINDELSTNKLKHFAWLMTSNFDQNGTPTYYDITDFDFEAQKFLMTNEPGGPETVPSNLIFDISQLDATTLSNYYNANFPQSMIK